MEERRPAWKKVTPAWKSRGMRGRVWTDVVIDGIIGLGGWEEGIVVFSFILLLFPLVSIEHRGVDGVNE